MYSSNVPLELRRQIIQCLFAIINPNHPASDVHSLLEDPPGFLLAGFVHEQLSVEAVTYLYEKYTHAFRIDGTDALRKMREWFEKPHLELPVISLYATISRLYLNLDLNEFRMQDLADVVAIHLLCNLTVGSKNLHITLLSSQIRDVSLGYLYAVFQHLRTVLHAWKAKADMRHDGVARHFEVIWNFNGYKGFNVLSVCEWSLWAWRTHWMGLFTLWDVVEDGDPLSDYVWRKKHREHIAGALGMPWEVEEDLSIWD